jgi:hypothetical protein
MAIFYGLRLPCRAVLIVSAKMVAETNREATEQFFFDWPVFFSDELDRCPLEK